MSFAFSQIEPETRGQVTLDVGHSSDVVFKVAVALVIGLVIVVCWWLFSPRNGDPKIKLKLLFSKLRSLFKNEWTWRLYCILQITGFIAIACLAATNDNHWSLLPRTSWNNEMTWDFFDSDFWTYHYENWFAMAFIVGPFLLSKATDWIFAAQKKSPPSDRWKQN